MSRYVELIETGELGDRSYVAHDGVVAVVVIRSGTSTDRVGARRAGSAVRACARCHPNAVRDGGSPSSPMGYPFDDDPGGAGGAVEGRGADAEVE